MNRLASPRTRGEDSLGAGRGRRTGTVAKLAAGAIAPLLAVAALALTPAAALAAGSTVNGTVSVAAGANAGRVHVLLLDTSGSEVASATVTDNSGSTTTGTYSFDGVANGVYKVYFIDQRGDDDVLASYYGGSTAFAGATTITVNGDYTIPAITLGSGSTISGNIGDANTGDTSDRIEACSVGTPDQGQVGYWGPAVDGQLCSPGSVSAGSYSIGGLQPGAAYRLVYRFTNASAGYTDNYYVDGSSLTADLQSASQFTAPTGAPLGAAFTVPALGGFSGTVTSPSGLADSSLSIEATDAAGTVLTSTPAFSSSGSYTVTGLLPGSYRVEFLPDSSLIAPGFYNAATTLATATPVNVSSGSVTPNIGFALTAAASISGTVTAAQGGADVGGIEVDVVDADGNVLTSAFTNANGTYSIPGLPAGNWYLRFDGGSAFGGTYYATEFYGGSSMLAGSVPVVLTSGETLDAVNQALLVQSTLAPGAPVVTRGTLSGLSGNKVGLRFRLAAGTGVAGYLASFRVKLPKYVSWNRATIRRDLVIARDTYTYVIKGGQLVVTFPTGKKTVNVQIKAGGIRVGPVTASEAKAGRLASETVDLSATDTTGLTTSLSYTVERPR